MTETLMVDCSLETKSIHRAEEKAFQTMTIFAKEVLQIKAT